MPLDKKPHKRGDFMISGGPECRGAIVEPTYIVERSGQPAIAISQKDAIQAIADRLLAARDRLDPIKRKPRK